MKPSNAPSKPANPELAKLGMNRETGKPIARQEHIAQSIQDILTTPIGSRIQRREYGSYLFDLIDSAGNEAGQLRLVAALVDAVNQWEPRVLLENAAIDVTFDGSVSLNYDYRDRQKNSTAELLQGSATLM